MMCGDRDVFPVLDGLPRNLIDIWQFSFTEMFNNAINHAGGLRDESHSFKVFAQGHRHTSQSAGEQ